jgi:predicted  nucleic acid-binding Zn-ribbon protein
LPQIDGEQNKKEVKQAYESIEKKIQEHYREEQKTLQMIFDAEDDLDKASIELLQQENLLAKTKHARERENLEDQIDHLRNKMQILEIDLSDISLQYKDLVAKRKLIQERCQTIELENTNALILHNLLK